MNPLKAYEVTISFSDYRFSTTLSYDEMEDAVGKLAARVLRLTDAEMAFFCMPDFLESVNELERDDSTCFQVSKSRAFTLNVKRII